jgi:integrase
VNTTKAYASRIRCLENVLQNILGVPFPHFMPLTGTVDKSLVQTFLWCRLSEGATRAMVLSELKLWQETLLEVGESVLPQKWMELKVNRLFPKLHVKKPVAKQALAIGTVKTVLLALVAKASSTNRIERVMAIRDIWFLILGFVHLLRVSKIINTRVTDISGDKLTLLVRKSKTD